MRPPILSIFFVTVATILTLVMARPMSAATFEIPDGDVAGLAAAINSANANIDADTISLADRGIYTLTAPDLMGGPDGPTGLPSITSPIIVNGNGATIQRSTADGTLDFRILHVAAGGDLTLNSVTVSDGRATGGVSPAQDCGGIRLERSGRLTLNSSVVSNNFSSFLGGGICARPDSILVINESAVANNVAIDGGGIFLVDRAVLDIIDSTISGNSANHGGGIFNDNGAATHIAGSIISGNTATGWGGGIGNISFGSAPDFGTRLAISDSVVSGNSGGDGGGIFSNIGMVQITASVISNNAASFGGAASTNFRSVFTVNDSCIFDNPGTSVLNDAVAPVMDATGNWWGAPDGPSGVGPGSGDAVSANVEFVPFRVARAPACSVVDVIIDIKPNNKRNPINPRSRGKIPVAILSSNTAAGEGLDFDALQVDPASARLGPEGAAAVRYRVNDVDHDGDADLLLLFKTLKTGVACGDTEAAVTGETFSGQAIIGTDTIRTVGCD